MILQAGAHAGQVLQHGNAVVLQQRGRANARELQNLRRAYAARAQDDLTHVPRVPRGQRRHALLAGPHLDAGAALATVGLLFNHQLAHLGAGPQFKIRARKAGRP